MGVKVCDLRCLFCTTEKSGGKWGYMDNGYFDFYVSGMRIRPEPNIKNGLNHTRRMQFVRLAAHSGFGPVPPHLAKLTDWHCMGGRFKGCSWIAKALPEFAPVWTTSGVYHFVSTDPVHRQYGLLVGSGQYPAPRHSVHDRKNNL